MGLKGDKTYRPLFFIQKNTLISIKKKYSDFYESDYLLFNVYEQKDRKESCFRRKLPAACREEKETVEQKKEIVSDVDNEAKDWLAKFGYDVSYGAKPLKRTIQKYLTNPLSQELLMENFGGGDTTCPPKSCSTGTQADSRFAKRRCGVGV